MHFATGIPNWPAALLKMPDGAFVKSVSDPGLLREAKQRWAAAGRDPKRLFTDYRHYFADQQFGRDLDEARAIWRRNFATFIDGTYLREFAPFVDGVEEYNEYTDDGMRDNDPATYALRLINAQAAADVWNTEYRGRVVHSADGGEGLIPADCRLIIGNNPVGNDTPREFMQLALDEDDVVGVHPYTKYHLGVRDPQDFRYHSGRPFFNEQAYGLRPMYAMTESSPYFDAGSGWRAPVCIGVNVDALVQAMRLWVRDLRTTAAYQEGRILGPGAWFTSGGQGWEMYQLETPQLAAIADMLRVEWVQKELTMAKIDPALAAEIKKHTQAINDLVDGKWWAGHAVPFDIPPVNKTLTFYHADGSPFTPAKVLNVTWVMHCTAIAGDLLLVSDPVGTANDLWVRGADLPVPA